MIRLYRWDPAAKTASCPAPDELPAAAADITGDAFLWVDLEDPTPEEEERVFARFLPVHPLTTEDITRPRRLPEQGAHLPKVEEFPDYLFVVVNPLPWEICDPSHKPADGAVPAEGAPGKKLRLACGWRRPQLSVILTHNVLVTHHYDDLPSVNAVREYVARRGEATTGRGPDYLFHLILDEMVDEYAPVVERFAERLDRLELRMFSKPSRQLLSNLLRLKRQVIFLRKTLVLEREVLARLVRGEFRLVASAEIAYYRKVFNHLVRYTELIEGAREMVSDLMQTHLAVASNRLNEVMKVLTMISTIILPMSLIASIYGMNFEYLPETKWDYGYPFALGLMAFVGVGGFALFKWRRWI